MMAVGAVPFYSNKHEPSIRSCTAHKPTFTSFGNPGVCLRHCWRKHACVHRPVTARCQGKLLSDLNLMVPETQRRLVEMVESSNQVPLIVARTSFQKGEEVLRVPEANWITLRTVKESDIGKLVDGYEPWLQLALLLVHERAKVESGSESRLATYLQTLPKKLVTPAFWNDEDLNSIIGTQLWESSITYRYEEVMAELLDKNQAGLEPELVTFEAFCWGVGCVRARVHPPLEGDNVALVPVADLARHSRSPNVTWELDTGNLFQGGSSLVLRSLEDIADGQEILMNYGSDNLDNKVALDYGVVDGSSTMGGYSLQLQLPVDDPLFDDKADILELESIGSSISFDLAPGRDPPSVLLAFLRLLNCSGADAFHMESIFRNEAWDHMLEPLSEENEKMICETMIGGCLDALKPYKSISAFSPDGCSPAQKLASQVCGAEKEALEWTLEWFEDRKRIVNKLEFYAEKRLKSLKLLDEDGESTFEDMILGE